jgi:peptidylprolyl isomerase
MPVNSANSAFGINSEPKWVNLALDCAAMKIRYPLLLALLALSCKSQPQQSQDNAAANNAPAASVPPAPSAAPSAAAAIAEVSPASVQPAPEAIPAPGDVAEAPKDAKRTASGLQSKVLTAGKGKDHPVREDKVVVNYTGWTKDGKMFDSSEVRHAPATFGVSQVIPGWTEALQLMTAGEKRRVWIPAKLAYGDNPMGGAPKGDLVFDVELLEIAKAPPAPKTPTDVKAAPKNATKTASGLAYRVLQKGKGKDHPAATNRVTVHYTGWTTDGKMFDSSVTRGEPTTFGLNQVVKGWTEGVQLMVVGEKTRFWIPAELAYGSNPRPGAPSGMLVFDIELLNIQ